MANIANLLTEHIDIWIAADTEKKSGRGRASGNAGSVYGVKKLRELILGLAISGKLLPQKRDDIPTHEISKKLGLQRKILNEDLLIEFDLPDTWQWFCVSDLCDLKTGATPSTSVLAYYGGNIRWLVSGDIHGNEIYDCEGRITESGLSNSNCKILPKNSILIALNGQGKTRATVAMLRCEAACNQSLVAMISKYDELILPEFIWLNLKYRYTEIRDITGQNQRRGLNMGLVGDLSVSVPPLAEQQRIVAKVDELMALCDQLEQQHSNAQEAHETLVSQLLATLTQSQDAADYSANWQRICAHFDVLFTTEASIDALKQTLLQLAVMGKLVPQDPNDEPASELLKRIQAEKAKLSAEGKLKKEKTLAPISEDEKPFELQKGWEWVRFETLLINAFVGLDRGKNQQSDELKYAYFKMNNIKNEGGFDYTNFVRVNATSEELVKFKLNDGDFLFNTRNSRELVGKTCVIRNLPEMDVIYNNNILRVKFSNFIQPEFIDNWFRSKSGSNSLDKLKSNTTNVCAIYQGNLFDYLCVLAPQAEQHRIVAKVDALMALCDQLKTRIQQANQQQQAIADALVAQALKPATDEIIDLATYRAAVTCNIIKRMQHNQAFGRTFAMKLLYLSQQHIGFETHLKFEREAAGPFDKWIYDFEREGIAAGWFGMVEKQLSNGKTKIEYQVKSAIDESLALFDNVGNAVQRIELDRLFTLFANKKTEEAEIIATLFAVWNDFLIDGNLQDDNLVIKEVRENWHSSKARFSTAQLKKWLNWMRSNSLVPKGRPSHTVYQNQLISS